VEDQYPEPNPCKRNNWKSHKFPTCNSVHELTLERPTSTIQPFDISYLGYVYIVVLECFDICIILYPHCLLFGYHWSNNNVSHLFMIQSRPLSRCLVVGCSPHRRICL
jgi:hypothetical protein